MKSGWLTIRAANGHTWSYSRAELYRTARDMAKGIGKLAHWWIEFDPNNGHAMVRAEIARKDGLREIANCAL